MTGQNARSQQANLREAFQRLGVLVVAWIRAEIRNKSPQRKISNETIRTYHFADNRVTDHASKHQIAAQELPKKFDSLIVARRLAIESAILDDRQTNNHPAQDARALD